MDTQREGKIPWMTAKFYPNSLLLQPTSKFQEGVVTPATRRVPFVHWDKVYPQIHILQIPVSSRKKAGEEKFIDVTIHISTCCDEVSFWMC